jgi:hypothetical protein
MSPFFPFPWRWLFEIHRQCNPLSSVFDQNVPMSDNFLDALGNFRHVVLLQINASNHQTPLLDQQDKISFAGGRKAYMENKIQLFCFTEK